MSTEALTHSESQTTLAHISVEGRARLLDMAYARLKFGLFSMPFVSTIFVWFYRQSHDDGRFIMGWSLVYWCAALFIFCFDRIYKKHKKRDSAQQMLNGWQSRIHAMAILHGIGLLAFFPLIGNEGAPEFKYLYLLTVAAIMAANATHQAPMVSVFYRFLFFGWHCNVLIMPWVFPEHWQFVMPLCAIYGLGMYRHARISHRFFVRMIWLEEESARLANDYKEVKDIAEQALTAKNQFLTTASHDLRQPVHAMGFLIESIAHRNQNPALTAPLLDLKQSVKVLTHMFDSLLSLSKIESGVTAAQVEVVSLNQLMDEMMIVFGEEAAGRGLQLRVWHASKPAMVWADAILLKQSMSNLIHNALRYTKRGGILMGVRRRGDAWQFEVWDTGIGVVLAEQQQIYSPFFRNQHAWQIDSAGHGLGLAVVARCAELMNAAYGLTSKEGRGSRFWLCLPAASVDYIESPIEKNQPSLKPFSGGKCLLIDDDPQICASWDALLTSWGVDSRCSASGLQAIQVLNDGFQPQAIFCDQRLRAGESGIEVLRTLLELRPEANGAMVSGEFNSPELLQAEDEGYLVLHKPLDVRVLHEVLLRWLRDDNPPN